MKAIYKTPKIHVLHISSSEIMIAGSGDQIDMGYEPTPINPDNARAKRGSLSWDE